MLDPHPTAKIRLSRAAKQCSPYTGRSHNLIKTSNVEPFEATGVSFALDSRSGLKWRGVIQTSEKVVRISVASDLGLIYGAPML
jgi:hypothetical protein